MALGTSLGLMLKLGNNWMKNFLNVLLTLLVVSIVKILAFNVISTLVVNVSIALIMAFSWDVIMDSLRIVLVGIVLTVYKLIFIRFGLSGDIVDERIHL